jgi:class 3 adenylate cyclase/TolB-like protein/Tfp pilus assembly protein PilF
MADATAGGVPLYPAQRVRRAIVVVDVVESVRLMQQHEDDVIDRWRRFVNEVVTEVLPPNRGRLVKSLGDGMLLEFERVPQAVAAALDIQRRIVPYNANKPPAEAMALRIGCHDSDIVVDAVDIYGSGVNLAARLATAGERGDIIISTEFRDQVVASFDAEVEDLGRCYLKHMAEPVQAYRIGPVDRAPGEPNAPAAGSHETAGLAVIPFSSRSVMASETGQAALGDLLADDLIGMLSRLGGLRVISRLSSSWFADRVVAEAQVAQALDVPYVVRGSYFVDGDTLHLFGTLIDTRSAEVAWTGEQRASLREVLAGDSAALDALANGLAQAVVGHEVQRTRRLPLRTLESYSILFGAISMMHRLSAEDFARAGAMLNYLVERHPQATTPRAWLGKWHVLRVAQGWSPNPAEDAHLARRVIGRALEIDPEHSLALAVDGLVCAYITKELDAAGRRYDAALAANPNEGLALLFQSAWHAYHDRGGDAVRCALQAQKRSPLDPLKYFYDNFTCTAMLSADDYEGAVRYGLRSLQANRGHGPTLRMLAIAQSLAGDLPSARATLTELLQQEPNFTLRGFQARYPGLAGERKSKYAAALRAVGLHD